MTTRDVLVWLKRNISPYILKALAERPGVIYTEAWLAGIACRETGQLIAKWSQLHTDPLITCSIMRGDFSQRPGEKEKSYHGYGLTQVDIGSFPDFVKSGDWKDPYKCFVKTIDILESKRKYLQNHFESLDPVLLNEYITASYNCGEGNERKVIERHLDPDAYTTGHNYAEEVLNFAHIYSELVWP